MQLALVQGAEPALRSSALLQQLKNRGSGAPEGPPRLHEQQTTILPAKSTIRKSVRERSNAARSFLRARVPRSRRFPVEPVLSPAPPILDLPAIGPENALSGRRNFRDQIHRWGDVGGQDAGQYRGWLLSVPADRLDGLYRRRGLPPKQLVSQTTKAETPVPADRMFPILYFSFQLRCESSVEGCIFLFLLLLQEIGICHRKKIAPIGYRIELVSIEVAHLNMGPALFESGLRGVFRAEQKLLSS